MRQLRKILLGMLLGSALGVVSVTACPTCKDSFTKEDSANGTKLVSKGLNASVASGLVWLVVANGRSGSGDKLS